MLLVDKVFLGDITGFGLEEFGTSNPRLPLPTSHLLVERSGRFLGLRDDRSPCQGPVAVGALADPGCLDLLSSEHLVVAVGDTWAAEQSWSALWRFDVGIASVLPREGSRLGMGRGRPGSPT